MPKKILIFLLILFTAYSYSQDNRQTIFGKISSNSITVKDVHIFNKTSRKGTISNSYGEFRIPVKEKDTLLISDIQYEEQEIIITKMHLQNLQLSIYLKSKVNELSEVEIKEHELTGILANDAKNTITHISKVDEDVLDFSTIDFSIPVILEIDEFSRSRTSSDAQLLPPSGNILGLLGFVLNPLIKEASKIGKTKRNLKRIERQSQIKILNAPKEIRIELGDSFFINTIKIPPQNIDNFISYCRTKRIAHKYVHGSKIEVIDILIEESKSYLKSIKDEK